MECWRKFNELIGLIKEDEKNFSTTKSTDEESTFVDSFMNTKRHLPDRLVVIRGELNAQKHKGVFDWSEMRVNNLAHSIESVDNLIKKTNFVPFDMFVNNKPCGNWSTVVVILQFTGDNAKRTGFEVGSFKCTDTLMCLFGAFDSGYKDTYENLKIGNIIMILSPGVTVNTINGRKILKIDSPNSIICIGDSMDFGNCKSRLGCRNLIDTRLYSLCDKHRPLNNTRRSELLTPYSKNIKANVHRRSIGEMSPNKEVKDTTSLAFKRRVMKSFTISNSKFDGKEIKIGLDSLKPSSLSTNTIKKIGFDPSEKRRRDFLDVIKRLPEPMLGKKDEDGDFLVLE